jgi:S-adenosylmethionine-diacylglycerol 3-amino-3-carboxypropyl transferase
MIDRVSLPGAQTMRLFFAQVREDPLLELDALAPAADQTIVIVSSGGCTALSLLGRGAGEVIGCDLNVAQNHLVELKAAAVRSLGARDAAILLGAVMAKPVDRRALYRQLRGDLSEGARAYWDRRGRAVGKGVIAAGVTEKFMGFIARLVKLFIHGPRRVRALLASPDLDAQRALYRSEWNNRRWRALFRILLNRWVMSRTYDPAFFANVENPSFAKHFHRLAEHALTEIPVATNYFVQQLLTGAYPMGQGGAPPYLADDAETAARLRHGKLTLVDGALTDYLRTRPAASVDGYSLSNICEWLSPEQIDDLFAEIVRTARPGARVCFRNFVGWTEVPERWRAQVVEDRARGERLIAGDRSMVQRRFAVCSVALTV